MKQIVQIKKNVPLYFKAYQNMMVTITQYYYQYHHDGD